MSLILSSQQDKRWVYWKPMTFLTLLGDMVFPDKPPPWKLKRCEYRESQFRTMYLEQKLLEPQYGGNTQMAILMNCWRLRVPQLFGEKLLGIPTLSWVFPLETLPDSNGKVIRKKHHLFLSGRTGEYAFWNIPKSFSIKKNYTLKENTVPEPYLIQKNGN